MKKTPFLIQSIEVGSNYTDKVVNGGVRPVTASVTFAMPASDGSHLETVRIFLTGRRLERLLDAIQRLTLDEFTAQLTRNDDQLIGGCDLVKPEPLSPEELRIENIKAALIEAGLDPAKFIDPVPDKPDEEEPLPPF